MVGSRSSWAWCVGFETLGAEEVVEDGGRRKLYDGRPVMFQKWQGSGAGSTAPAVAILRGNGLAASSFPHACRKWLGLVEGCEDDRGGGDGGNEQAGGF